jgi:hypothetical protein
MKTIENNKLIAEFMCIKYIYDDKYIENIKEMRANGVMFEQGYMLSELKYDTDWNWLMSVVEKILDISLELDSMEMYYNITDSIPYINSTYNACIEFIKWYNENKLK